MSSGAGLGRDTKREAGPPIVTVGESEIRLSARSDRRSRAASRRLAEPLDLNRGFVEIDQDAATGLGLLRETAVRWC